jgi:uncharacterized protein
MKLWIDADAMPREVKEIAFRAVARLELPAILVANQDMWTPHGNPNVSNVVVEGGADAADRHIVEHAAAEDVAITADIPLASLLIAKGLAVIDPRGREYTPDNIGEILSTRDLMSDLRGAGLVTGGPAAFQARDRIAFANALDRVLTRRTRGRAARPDRSAPDA